MEHRREYCFLSAFNSATDFLQDAVLWRDAPEYAYRRSIFASQHYVSYERVNDYTFYLNNVDSRLLYDQIYKHHPENFPPAPRPVPVQNQPNEPPAGMHDPDRGGDPTRGMGQQPGRGMPARGGPSAAGRGGIPGQGNHPQTRTQDLPVCSKSLSSCLLQSHHIKRQAFQRPLLFANMLTFFRALDFGLILQVIYVHAMMLLRIFPPARKGGIPHVCSTSALRTAIPSELSYDKTQDGIQVLHQRFLTPGIHKTH